MKIEEKAAEAVERPPEPKVRGGREGTHVEGWY